jgi:hypothetical protein
MGTMSFLLPEGLSLEAARELELACMAGGPDSMPWPTRVQLEPGRLTVHRDVQESGYLVAPWEVDGAGRLMQASATLIERSAPYHCQVELARGKLNRLRSQAVDWQAGGLPIPQELDEQIHSANLAFGRAVVDSSPEEISRQAQSALVLSHRAADRLVQLYLEQEFRGRREREPRPDTVLGCRLEGLPPVEAAALFAGMGNSVCLPFTWSRIESSEGVYDWRQQDALLDWAEERDLVVTGGPLVDFSSAQMPDWLWLWERDLPSLAKFVTGYVGAAVKHYQGRIQRWHLTSASNSAVILSLSEEELLWLTVKAVQGARQVDADIEVIVGVAQPWGEYMAVEDRSHSPWVFADTLIRSELNLAALDLEIVMGVTPRGSYCRDLLDTARMLYMYSLLGVPLRITLGYPSSVTGDRKADPELRTTAGYWRGAISLDTQAAWAAAFGGLALCKPYVQAVHWTHFSDAHAHQFPHCGLLDAKGSPKPALQQLRLLREKHLAVGGGQAR